MKDFTEQKNELLAKKSEKLAKANEAVAAGRMEEAKTLRDEIVNLNDSITTLDQLAEASAEAAGSAAGEKTADVKPFASLGEQLQAVAKAAKTGKIDDKLTHVNNSVLGANETSGEDGGFALQSDFAMGIMESAVASSPFLSMLDVQTVRAGCNQMRFMTPNEANVSDSVFGGIRMYWASEGGTVDASKASFQEMKVDLEKLMGVSYVTSEMLTDAPFLTGFLGTGFSLAADRILMANILNGDGVGKPLGILNSGALVTVAKDTNQAAGTLTGNNIIKMKSRSMPKNRNRLVWLMHPDMEEQLPGLSISSGSAEKFLWNPEGGLGNLQYEQVLGKNVMFDDSCSAVGSKGDVLLVDPFQYLIIKQGAARQDWSIHVQFLTDQNAFRVIYRMNGAPKTNSPVTLKNSANTRSPFVTLAARG